MSSTPLKINILGCYAATPRTFNNPSAQVLTIKNKLFLIDCGEGTQVQLRKHQIKFNRISHIFISHLHGDHFFGLVGLITSFSLLNRQEDLHIFGPTGIKEIILLQLKISKSYTGYSLFFHEIENPESSLIWEDEQVSVQSIPLDHRISTYGYLFKEKNTAYQLNLSAIAENEVEHCYFNKLKMGQDVPNRYGTIIPFQQLTYPPIAEKSYAYCSDTAYTESIIPIIQNATVLYHESTFLASEAHLCAKTKHSTAKEAATIAQKAGVQHLILGHFSTRYKDLTAFLREAQPLFNATQLADDGTIFTF